MAESGLSKTSPVTRLLLAAALGVPLLASGCSLRADDSYAKPFTTEVSDWRQYLGVAVAVQVLLLAWVFWSTGRKGKMSRLFLGFLLIPLLWTKIGEWLYRLGSWIIDYGTVGKVAAIALSFLGGINGTTNVQSYILGGVIFNDPEFLLYWAVPGVAASYVAAFAFLIRGQKCKQEKQK